MSLLPSQAWLRLLENSVRATNQRKIDGDKAGLARVRYRELVSY